MVSFTTAAIFSLAALSTLAAPTKRYTSSNSSCLCDSEAQQVADNWAELIRNYSDELADASLTVDFIDYSESVNTLINTCPQGDAAQPLPLLAPTFSSREEFKEGQGQQAPINIEQLNIEHSCQSVTIRWKTTNTAPIPNPKPVIGLILLEVEKAPAASQFPWLINTVYSEFNAGAWLQNLQEAGICTATNPDSPPVNDPTISSAPSGPAAAPPA